MARQNITFQVNLRQDECLTSRTYGRYYPEAESKEPLSLKGFAKHLSEHGKLATYDMLVLVLQNIVSCMKELLAQGQPVKLDGLGTFRPTVQSVKGGADSVEGALTMGIDKLVDGIHICYIPEGAKGEKLTSKAFKEECVLEFKDVVRSVKKTIDGKEKRYQERIPISSYAIAKYEPEEGGDDTPGSTGD